MHFMLLLSKGELFLIICFSFSVAMENFFGCFNLHFSLFGTFDSFDSWFRTPFFIHLNSNSRSSINDRLKILDDD